MKLTEGVPAWTVRAAVLGAVAIISILLLAQGVGLAGLIAVFGGIAALMPSSPAPALVIITTAVCCAIVFDSPFNITVLVLLPLVHVVHIGSALAAVIPGTARIHLAALRPAAIRFVVVQTTALAVASVAAIVPKGVTPTVLEIGGLIAAAVLAACAAVVIMNRPQ
jgi:hypothetical protein